MIDLRLGRWQDKMADIPAVDTLITDAPYSERTHRGFRAGGVSAGVISEQPGIITYDAITRRDVREAVQSWAPRVRRFFVVFGDHVTSVWWERELQRAGMYTFAPIPWIKRDAPPRFSGDGPQSSTEWVQAAVAEDAELDPEEVLRIVVARKRIAVRSGSLPGYYFTARVGGPVNGSKMAGQKNLEASRRLVRDYSRPGDLVADIYGGTFTFAHACQLEGRSCVSSEMDAGRYEIGRGRFEATGPLFGAA